MPLNASKYWKLHYVTRCPFVKGNILLERRLGMRWTSERDLRA